MSLGAWLIVLATLALVGLALWAIDVSEPRLTRWAKVAIVAAVILMAWRPELWPWLTAVGLAACVAILTLYLVAGVAAEVQRWREARRSYRVFLHSDSVDGARWTAWDAQRRAANDPEDQPGSQR